MLHSAAGNASGIPQPILDAKQEEVRQREIVQKELEVDSIPFLSDSPSACLPDK